MSNEPAKHGGESQSENNHLKSSTSKITIKLSQLSRSLTTALNLGKPTHDREAQFTQSFGLR